MGTCDKDSVMSDSKTSIRPQIPTIKKKDSVNPVESFQNNTLRPIIKLQHELLIAYFNAYLIKRKIGLADLTMTQREEAIKKAFSKDAQLKNGIRSLVIGLFTLEEFKFYLTTDSAINKRIHSIIEERISSFYLN